MAHNAPDTPGSRIAEAYERLSRAGFVRRLLELARDEDLHPGGIDVTTRACATPDQDLTAAIRFREGGIVAGLAVIPEVIEVFGEVFGGGVAFEARARDGDAVPERTTVGVLRGPASGVLTMERTVLNLLGRLSGIATRTSAFVRAVEGTGASICDTRKTTPGVRALEKYAVVCGGGVSHRMSLADAVLIKDNHLAGVGVDELASFVQNAAERARGFDPAPGFVQVEVDSLAQFEQILTLAPGVVDIVLLDNFVLADLREAVTMRAAADARVLLEASGGVNLESVRAIAETGVDRISIGGLTHQAVSLDVGLDAIDEGGA